MISKVEDVTLDNLCEKLEGLNIQAVLFVDCDSREHEKRMGKFLTTVHDFLSEIRVERCLLNERPSGAFDLIIPVYAYGVDLGVRRRLENFALRHLGKYFIIYEDTYHTIRMARASDLKYRLYVQPLARALFAGLAVFCIVLPLYTFYPVAKLVEIWKRR